MSQSIGVLPDYMRHFVGPGAVVVNIGANLAAVTSEIERIVGNGGRVYSFDGEGTSYTPTTNAAAPSTAEQLASETDFFRAGLDVLGREKIDLLRIDSTCLDLALQSLGDQLGHAQPVVILEVRNLAQSLRAAEALWRRNYALYTPKRLRVSSGEKRASSDSITLIGLARTRQMPSGPATRPVSSPADVLSFPLPLLDPSVLSERRSGIAAISQVLAHIEGALESSRSRRRKSTKKPARDFLGFIANWYFSEAARPELSGRDARESGRALVASPPGAGESEAYERLNEKSSRQQKELQRLQDELASVSNSNQVARRLLMAGVGNWKSFLPIRIFGRESGLRAQLRALERSKLFDRQWYIDTYQDVQTSGMDPLVHYLLFGGFEGRLPNPHFDSGWYLSAYHDVRHAGINPLLHYVLYGAKERRATSQNFDTAFYLDSNPDVASSHMNPLFHFLRHGGKEGRKSVKYVDEGADLAVAPRPTAPPGSEWEKLIRATAGTRPKTAEVDIIIPVYRGYDDTLACIHSVLTSRNLAGYELVVIDDRSPERKLSDMLAQLGGAGLFTYLANDQNLGFVATCNRGMALHPERDVVLLNSDTVVYNDWLDRLRTAAGPPEVGTVTPLSTNATICSYPIPNRDNNAQLEIDYAILDELCAKANAGKTVELPTAIGFCMYIRRDCLADVGLFDEATFGRGYGEENDFCRRAAKRSWRNIAAPNVFVRHTGEVSFSLAASDTRREAQAALQQKHPEYLDAVREFISKDPLAPFRRRIDAARLGTAGGEQLVLHVAHTWGGGVTRHISDLADQFKESGWGSIVMTPTVRDQPLVDITGVTPLTTANLSGLDLSTSQDEITNLLEIANVKRIHIHSLAGWPLSATKFLPELAAKLGVPYGFTFHDYLPFCPRINLIDQTGVYCGERGIQTCRTCIAKNGSPFGDVDVDYWRLRYDRLLGGADGLIVPSEDAAKRVRGYLPDQQILVRPHAQDAAKIGYRSPKRAPGSRLRVAVIGAIGPHKGSAVLAAIAKNALSRRLPIDFVVIGYTDRDSEFKNLENVRITGSYPESEVQDIIRAEAPHIAFLPSVWPETFCYTLSIALSAGLPVAVFDLGAQSERIKELKESRSIIIPIELATRPDKINDMLLGGADRIASADDSSDLELPEVRYTCASYYGLDS